MIDVSLKTSHSYIYEWGRWLDTAIYKNSIIARLNYSISSRIILLGIGLTTASEAISRIGMSSLALFAYTLSVGYWKKAKVFSFYQFQRAMKLSMVSLVAIYSLVSSKQFIHRLPKTEKKLADLLYNRVGEKLDYQFRRCQKQAAEEKDKEFLYLEAKADFKGVSHKEKVLNTEVGVCHYIGKRPTMEDEHLATSFWIKVGGKSYPVELFGIFDGHGGPEASLYIRKNLKMRLQESLKKFCKDDLSQEAIWNALKATFIRLDREFKNLQSGSTATVAILLDGHLWTANVGDSRTILDNGLQLSEDAKPQDPYYRRNIEALGGVVRNGRINGQLAVARAIGDHGVGAVSPRPKITVYPLANLEPNAHLILTCDGIYDVASTRQVAKSVKAHRDLSAKELAKNIVYSAYEAGSEDNLSAMVIKLN